MAKTQSVWALDIGQAALKALKLAPAETPGRVTAEAFDFVEYPKILSQPDADPETLVQDALRTFLERNDLKGCKIAIAVPGQAGLVKFIKLPPVEKKRIPDIVKFEAKQQIPFALEEVIWDYQQIGGDTGDDDFTMAEVGLFAMKRDQINRAILPFRVAGLEVDVVQMGPIALYNFIAFDRLDTDHHSEGEEKPKLDGSVVVIDVGVDNTDLIITDGVRIWQRNVPIGGNHFTRALTKELKQTFAKAEHLKRNAMDAPDPRAVFTAMRGVFNDFSSEVNRSIGFYSSVNRTAKIAKVIGLGNGFKLPGLQKFLATNLNYEVEKFETFERLSGEDVTTAKQFQENLASFAVAYGLGVQGLGLGKLKTNLLPPEIGQVRTVRKKKPWVLAASALMMLGFSAAFMSDWKALATVTTDFKGPREHAERVAKTGADNQSKFDDAVKKWGDKLAEGESLVPDTAGGPSSWPFLFDMVDDMIYNPVNDRALEKQVGHKLEPDSLTDLKDREIAARNRVHIDAIKPAYVSSLKKDWIDSEPMQKLGMRLMAKYDVDNLPPDEPGWVIQIVGHHYNPKPKGKKDSGEYFKDIDLGPITFLYTKVIPRLAMTKYRVFGVRNATVAWALYDDNWTTENAIAGLPSTIPLLPRASGGSAGGGMMGGGGGGGMMGGGGDGAYGAAPVGGGAGGYGGKGGGMYGDPMSMGGGAADKKEKNKNVITRTRTDFLIQFAWVPPKPDAPQMTKEEVNKLDKDVRDAQTKQTKAIQIPSDQEVLNESKRLSDVADKKLTADFKKKTEALEAGKSATPGKTAAPVPPGPGVPATPTPPPTVPKK